MKVPITAGQIREFAVFDEENQAHTRLPIPYYFVYKKRVRTSCVAGHHPFFVIPRYSCLIK